MSGATQGAASIMDRFLEDSRATGRQVSLYLVSGYQLKGQVVEFDAHFVGPGGFPFPVEPHDSDVAVLGEELAHLAMKMVQILRQAMTHRMLQ